MKNPVAQIRRALDNDELTLYCQPSRALIGPPGYPIAEQESMKQKQPHAAAVIKK